MEDQNTVILDFQVDIADSLKRMAELRMRIAELRAEQKNLDTSTAEGRTAYERYGAEIQVAQGQLRGLQNMQVNVMKAQNEELGYLDRLKAQNAALTAQLNSLSKADANYVAREAELQRAILATTNELKAAEEAHGDNRRSVGNYEIATKSLSAELGELTDRLVRLAAEGKQNSAVYNELAQRAAVLRDAQDDVNKQIGFMASDTSKLDTLSQGVNGVVQSYVIWQQTSKALGIEDEELQKTITALMVVMQALQAATVLQNLAQKQSNLYRVASNLLQKIGITQTKAEAVANTAAAATVKAQTTAETALTAAKVKGGIAAKVAAAAQWAWNAAIAANPVGAILIAVVALIAGIVALVKVFNSSNAAADAAADANKRYEEQASKSADRIHEINAQAKKDENELQRAQRERLLEMKKNGATGEQIAAQESKDAKELADIHTRAHNARIEELRLQDAEVQSNLIAQQKYLKTLRQGSDEYEEQRQKVQDLRNALIDLRVEISDEQTAKANERLALAEAEVEAQKRVSDETYNQLTKSQELRKRALLAQKKLEDGYSKESFQKRQQYAQDIEEIEVNAEKERLKTARRFGKITNAEYEAGMKDLSVRMASFQQSQAKEATKWAEGQRDAILSLFDKTTEEKIADVEEKFAEAFRRLENEAAMPPDRRAFDSEADYEKAQTEYENFMLRKAEITLRLEEQQQKEIEAIRKDAEKQKSDAIDKEVQERYADDLRAFENNERKKLETEQRMLADQKAAKQAAGLETYEEDRKMAANEAKISTMNMNLELLQAGKNAKKRYEIRMKYLDEEATKAKGDIDKLAQIEQERAKATAEYKQQVYEQLAGYASQAMSVADTLNQLWAGISETQLNRVQAQYDEESEMLKEKLEAGYITQEEYDEKQEALDKKLEKEQKKIQRQEAIREKAMAMFKIAVDTAMAMVALWASPGFPGAIPMMAVVGALSAVQLAAVASQPLPKAARGRRINGRSHGQGGEIVVAEDGEIIMNKNSVRMFGPELSAMSVAGGGVPFTNSIPDGGFTARTMMSEMSGLRTMERALSAALLKMKIYTTIEDIRRGERLYTEVESRGTF